MKKRYVVLVLLVLLAGAWYWATLPGEYHYNELAIPDQFAKYYVKKKNHSRDIGIPNDNAEKWVRYSDGKTNYAIYYIHGYSAARAEGEMVLDSVADILSANTYYTRLPGHGIDSLDLGNIDFREMLDVAITDLRAMQLLGDKVIVVGTSMGGMIATYLAAEYPDLVDGLVLVSPFYDYGIVPGHLLKIPGLIDLISAVQPERPKIKSPELDERVMKGYNDHWSQQQMNASLKTLEELRNFAARDKYYEKVQAPVLLMYYYKDDDHMDHVADIDAMRDAFSKFKSTRDGNPLNKEVAIADGNHVMLSYYIKTDKTKVMQTLLPWIQKL